jgi:CRISPR-associated protein Cmr2
MAYLFQCAIGPVQDFIASARRSRDLWYGSWLLSELAKAAAKSLADQYGFDKLIFPAPSDYKDLLPDSTFTVPNKVVAEVADTPGVVADKVKAALDERLQNIWGQVLSTCGPIDNQLANEQLSDLIEYYWVGVPFTGNGDYDSARRLAEAALAARKATRNFGQVVGKPIPKSSLDGARETVIPESAYPSGFQDAERDKKNWSGSPKTSRRTRHYC